MRSDWKRKTETEMGGLCEERFLGGVGRERGARPSGRKRRARTAVGIYVCRQCVFLDGVMAQLHEA